MAARFIIDGCKICICLQWRKYISWWIEPVSKNVSTWLAISNKYTACVCRHFIRSDKNYMTQRGSDWKREDAILVCSWFTSVPRWPKQIASWTASFYLWIAMKLHHLWAQATKYLAIFAFGGHKKAARTVNFTKTVQILIELLWEGVTV